MADDSLAGGEGVDRHQPGGQRWAGVERISTQGLKVAAVRGARSTWHLTLCVVKGVCHMCHVPWNEVTGSVAQPVLYLEVGGQVGKGGEVVAGRDRKQDTHGRDARALGSELNVCRSIVTRQG